MAIRIMGTGKFVPEKMMTNEELAKLVDTSDEWIYTRTGIKERRIADKESTSSMGSKASFKALEDAKVKAEEVELIIVATMTPEYATPSTACLIQKELGASKAIAFDINAACSGFLFALHMAKEFLANGTVTTALVVGSEKMSSIMNWEDRNTCVLFGDGAGAIVLQQLKKLEERIGQGAGGEHKGILSIETKSMGKDYACLTAKANRVKTPFAKSITNGYIRMEGREVFQFACSTVPESIERVLAMAKLTADDVDYFVLHQANIRILKKIAKTLGQDMKKFPANMEKYGNTSAASVPIVLDELCKKSDITDKKVVLAGFGGGLTYGSAVIHF